MESDPEGRNNAVSAEQAQAKTVRLNEVRPRRPEQSVEGKTLADATLVSMKSGLEGRNNATNRTALCILPRLNEVRPRRPEQFELERAMLAEEFLSQ